MNNDCSVEDIFSVLTCQHAFVDILNVSQRFIKSLDQPTKSHGLVGLFTNRQTGNKEAYGILDDFLHQLKGGIVEPITTRYVK